MTNPLPGSAFFPRSVLFALAAGLGLACSGARELPVHTPDPVTTRNLGSGNVVGFAHPEVEGVDGWLGIPFAEPPVGDLRWKAPRPPRPWTGTREALSFGSSCVQLAGPLGSRDGASAGTPTGTEDCLYLNVFAPRREGSPSGDDAGLPVMFWIHGGGNTIGDATVYDGAWLAKKHNVIVVTTHYRLGVLGWFRQAALRAAAASPEDASGNYGTLDLIRGLEWVHDEIAKFGGDPGRVTIFGESAGGYDVFALLLSPLAKGLFHRAISESGGLGMDEPGAAEAFVDADPPGDEGSSGEVLLALLERDGRASDRDGARAVLAAMSADEIAAYLRGKSGHELLAAFDGSSFGGMYSAPSNFRDGHVIVAEEPLEAFAAGHYNRVPFITGTNREETKLFAMFGSPHVSTLLGFPIRLKNRRLYDLDAEYGALSWRARAVDEPLTAMRPHQGEQGFAYRFDWDDEPSLLWLDFGVLLGAAHGLEIPFVFGRLRFFLNRMVFDEDRADLDHQLSDAMMSYWTQFAATGAPGRGRDGTLPEWTAWPATASGPSLMLLDSPDDGAIRMQSSFLDSASVIDAVATDPRLESTAERCALWANFVRFGGALSAADYATRDDGLCADHPLRAD